MNKAANKKLTSILMLVGVVLIVLSLVAIVVSEIAERKAEENVKIIASKLHSLMPDAVDGAPDDRSNKIMPVLSVENKDYIGLLELNSLDITLPIGEKWDLSEISHYPCKYMGSMYDSSLIIGGSDNSGQFDFLKTISNGDTLSVTDVTGLRFNYVVTDIRKTKDVSTEGLTSKKADLVLFARNAYSFDYTVVRCDLK